MIPCCGPDVYPGRFAPSDPTQDIQELFSELDSKFFQGKMKNNGVLLEWSEEPSLTAGYCYQLNDDVRRVKRCYIILNRPLLMLRRSYRDLVNTLLHQMIHAFLYTAGIKENHGPNFRHIMRNINEVAGTNITVFHKFYLKVVHPAYLASKGKPREEKLKHVKHVSFHDEVDHSAYLATKGKPREEKLKHVKHVRFHDEVGYSADLATKGKPREEKLKHDKHVRFAECPKDLNPPVQPKSMPTCHGIAKSSSQPGGIPSRSENKLKTEILSSYNGAVPDREIKLDSIKLIGYEDSETDSDSDFDFELEEKVDAARMRLKELFYMKENLKPWMDDVIYRYRHR